MVAITFTHFGLSVLGNESFGSLTMHVQDTFYNTCLFFLFEKVACTICYWTRCIFLCGEAWKNFDNFFLCVCVCTHMCDLYLLLCS